MNQMIEKILSYLSVFVLMAMLSKDMNGTNVGKIHVNDTNSFNFRESAKLMINYLSHYEIGDAALKHRAKIFMEKLEKNKNMRSAVAEIISTFLDEFDLSWLNSLFEELAKNKTEKTLDMLEKPFYEDDCIVDEDGIKCGGTAPNKDALGVTNDIKVQDYKEPSFTNNSSLEYYYGDIIYSPLEKEKFDKNKIYRQNFEGNYHESADTGDMAYQDLNIFNEDSSDIQDNRDFKESRYENSYPLNLMLNGSTGSTTDQYSYENESLDEEIGTEYRNQEMMENDKIFDTTLRLSPKKESINNEYYTHSSKSENINNAEPQKTNIAEKISDYSDEVGNYVVKNYEDKFSARNGEENPQSSESKSEKSYYYETYDDEEEIEENHKLFGRKLLEYNDEEMSENHISFARKLLEYRQLGEESPDDNDFDVSINNEYKIEIPLSKVLSGRGELNRAKRNSNPTAVLKGCPIPPSLETVQGYCKSIPSGTTCHLYCIKGYTFPEGISRRVKCSPNRGWDKGFEECKPYADCTLKLRSGGTLECALTTATKNAQCYVSCKRHGLYAGKAKKLYECNSLGLWTPVLPHCVVREGIDLVEPPPVVEHESIEYP